MSEAAHNMFAANEKAEPRPAPGAGGGRPARGDLQEGEDPML